MGSHKGWMGSEDGKRDEEPSKDGAIHRGAPPPAAQPAGRSLRSLWEEQSGRHLNDFPERFQVTGGNTGAATWVWVLLTGCVLWKRLLVSLCSSFLSIKWGYE